MVLITVHGPALADPSQLGAGASPSATRPFVRDGSTVFGFANLVFLPIADRLSALVSEKRCGGTYRSMDDSNSDSSRCRQSRAGGRATRVPIEVCAPAGFADRLTMMQTATVCQNSGERRRRPAHTTKRWLISVIWGGFHDMLCPFFVVDCTRDLAVKRKATYKGAVEARCEEVFAQRDMTLGRRSRSAERHNRARRAVVDAKDSRSAAKRNRSGLDTYLESMATEVQKNKKAGPPASG